MDVDTIPEKNILITKDEIKQEDEVIRSSQGSDIVALNGNSDCEHSFKRNENLTNINIETGFNENKKGDTGCGDLSKNDTATSQTASKKSETELGSLKESSESGEKKEGISSGNEANATIEASEPETDLANGDSATELSNEEATCTNRATVSLPSSETNTERATSNPNSKSGLHTAPNEQVKQSDELSDIDNVQTSEELMKESDKYQVSYDGRTSQLPDFAVVLSFFELFGALLEMPPLNITDLENAISNVKEFAIRKENQGVLEFLHLKLLRKLNKSSRYSNFANVSTDRCIKIIQKFCQALDLPCAWDLQEFGYHILTSAQRLHLLKVLCEIQFDENPKFRTAVQEAFKDNPAVLRQTPFGCEQEGLNVWFYQDSEFNVRIYAGEEDDASGDMWKVRAGNVDEIDWYISRLKSQCETNPKDLAAERIKELRVIKEREREDRRKRREERRKEKAERRKIREQQMKEAQKNKKRTRRRKKKAEKPPESSPEEQTTEEEDDDELDDDGCARCFANNQADTMLLCDSCDAAYHMLCLRPPITDVPEGDWFCPFCQQLQLIDKLQARVGDLKQKIRLRERRLKARERMKGFYGIAEDNILSNGEGDGCGRRSCRVTKRVDYKHQEYDQMISEALSNHRRSRQSSDTNDDCNEKPVRQPSKISGKFRSVETNFAPRRESDEVPRNQPFKRTSDGRFRDQGNLRHHTSKLIKRDKTKRRLSDVKGDYKEDYEFSSGSEFIATDSDDDYRKRTSMKDFLVDDDYDEIEKRHRNKYLRRSRRNKSIYSGRRRYDSSADGSASDSSSYHRAPRRSRRARAGASYRETYSDESDIGSAQNQDEEDGDEWKADELEAVEEVVEDEEDDDSLSSGISSDASNRCVRDSKRTRRRKQQKKVSPRKRRRVIDSDDTENEEEDDNVPYHDGSSDDSKGNKHSPDSFDHNEEESKGDTNSSGEPKIEKLDTNKEKSNGQNANDKFIDQKSLEKEICCPKTSMEVDSAAVASTKDTVVTNSTEILVNATHESRVTKFVEPEERPKVLPEKPDNTESGISNEIKTKARDQGFIDLNSSKSLVKQPIVQSQAPESTEIEQRESDKIASSISSTNVKISECQNSTIIHHPKPVYARHPHIQQNRPYMRPEGHHSLSSGSGQSFSHFNPYNSPPARFPSQHYMTHGFPPRGDSYPNPQEYHMANSLYHRTPEPRPNLHDRPVSSTLKAEAAIYAGFHSTNLNVSQERAPPTALPANRFYGGANNVWTPQSNQVNLHGPLATHVDTKGGKKRQKELAKQEKEIKRQQKLIEKELKKSKKSQSFPQTLPNSSSSSSMSFFKNMVISPDGS